MKRLIAQFGVCIGTLLALSPLSTAAEPTGSTGSQEKGVVANQEPGSKKELEPGLFATVNSRKVTQAEFHAAFGAYLQRKYYHGKVPDEELLKAREVVTDQILNSILLNEEALRRKLEPNAEELEKRVLAVDQRNARFPEWQRDRERVLPEIRENVAAGMRVSQLETAIRESVVVTPDEVRDFYLAKPELFTEPERFRIHAILLGVEPSAQTAVWEAAKAEAESIVTRIKGGADFAEIARMVSADKSGSDGGDMGYLHKGMLPESVQSALSKYELGVVGDPVRVLEGYGVFRLDERVPAKLRELNDVKERAEQLLLREKKDKAWEDFLASLRRKADIVVSSGPAQAAAAQK